DTGSGLSPEALGGLFQPFHRGNAGPSGAGLGLAISRELAELLGGTLELRSEPGQGTTASLRIPVSAPAGQEPAAAPGPAVGTRAAQVAGNPPPTARPGLSGRILLAEDHADNRRAIGLRLSLMGLDVTAVADGRQATEAALEARDEEQPFDVILMDMHMPI